MRARLDPWSGYGMGRGTRPVVLFGEEYSEDRELFWAALERGDAERDDWQNKVTVEGWLAEAIRAADPGGLLTNLAPSAVQSSTVARWTDRGLVGMAAFAVRYPGMRHPLMILDEPRLPPLLRLGRGPMLPWLHRHDAYLDDDGLTVEVSFTGYHEGAVDYVDAQVMETVTAVTFTVTGNAKPGLEWIQDVGATRWTTVRLEEPLGDRFLIGATKSPLVVVAKSSLQGRNHERRTTASH
jgi:hypothetical protein